MDDVMICVGVGGSRLDVSKCEEEEEGMLAEDRVALHHSDVDVGQGDDDDDGSGG